MLNTRPFFQKARETDIVRLMAFRSHGPSHDLLDNFFQGTHENDIFGNVGYSRENTFSEMLLDLIINLF